MLTDPPRRKTLDELQAEQVRERDKLSRLSSKIQEAREAFFDRYRLPQQPWRRP